MKVLTEFQQSSESSRNCEHDLGETSSHPECFQNFDWSCLTRAAFLKTLVMTVLSAARRVDSSYGCQPWQDQHPRSGGNMTAPTTAMALRVFKATGNSANGF